MDISQIKTLTGSIFKAHNVRKAGIFGSVSRGDHQDTSDVDILIEYGRKDVSLFDFIALKQDLEDTLQKKVDLVQYKNIKPSLKKYIMSDEKSLYEV